MSDIKLNLGCGEQVTEGWINVDYSAGARFAKLPFFRSINRRVKFFNQDWDERIFLHDLTTPFPWSTGYADVIYSSHTLEHLSRLDGLLFLKECARVLKPGGIIRIVVPDLRALVDDYLKGRLLADEFVENLGVLYTNKPGVKNRLATLYQFPHKCMYDSYRLENILVDCGFVVHPRAPFDSDIENIREIEISERTQAAVILEGIRQW